ncbi:LamG domain-containing protein [Streptomyces sp. NBC_01481]|uniref:LamG domain-containing protein n=1 Tax=Streptomyces sp. NBC_01481 TaxID=2975869 RepID=UPI00225BB774|nr:LamG domain-containing protein [Streptomyces sp. NBC_01481]MCX4584315.1 LamG domain-containing protein [Streptomyces sp. NBC_01481]
MRGRAMAAVAVSTLGIMAGPGTAAAADNQPPSQPLISELKTDFKACATGADAQYVGQPPVLTAVLRDPDAVPPVAVMLTAEFEMWWQDAQGEEQRRSFSPSYQSLSGSVQRWQVPSDIPADTPISWRVRASDGTAWSPWSSDGEGAPCRFVFDNESPLPATVTSTDYPAEVWRDGVGVYGSFHVDSPSDDVVEYKYGFLGGPYDSAKPDTPGGPVTIRHLPLRSGPDRLEVYPVDRSGRRAGPTTYTFLVNNGRAPVARWKLADATGSRTAAAESGPAARAGTGVAFGSAAPSGTGLTSTARLDGSSRGFLTPNATVVPPGKTFGVGGWVRPERTDLAMPVVSQDAGTTGPGFTLGLRTPAGAPVWSFEIGGTKISGGAPEAGEWAYVLGLYDAETGTARLYVNGHETGTAAKATPWAENGNLQIGRARGKDGYRNRWQGEIGDVRVYDRVVVPEELTRLAGRAAQSTGHWSLESATDGASPEEQGGQELRLGGGSSIFTEAQECDLLDPDCVPAPSPLNGKGHLELDGNDGYAATKNPVVDTSDSFTLAVRVRLTDREPAGPMTVLSQAGQHANAFKLRYVPAEYRWQLVMTHADAPDAPETVVASIASPDGGEGPGQRLAIVYDDATDQVRLYLDGYTNADATATFRSAWKSTGGLQVGRTTVGDGWGEYLHGAVDEIQAFSGVLSDRDIPALGT